MSDESPGSGTGSPDRDAEAESLAAKRYWILHAVRIAAVVVVLAGVVVMGRDAANEGYGGALLVAFGAFLFFFVPRTLARRWKSPS